MVCECVLFVVALQLSVVLAKVMSGDATLYDWLAVVASGGVYALGKRLADAKELFMPRFVVLVETGVLMSLALVLVGLIVSRSTDFGMIDSLGLRMRLLLATPLGIFLLTQFLLIQGARHAPELASLQLRQARPFNLVREVRRMVDYWTR